MDAEKMMIEAISSMKLFDGDGNEVMDLPASATDEFANVSWSHRCTEAEFAKALERLNGRLRSD